MKRSLYEQEQASSSFLGSGELASASTSSQPSTKRPATACCGSTTTTTHVRRCQSRHHVMVIFGRVKSQAQFRERERNCHKPSQRGSHANREVFGSTLPFSVFGRGKTLHMCEQERHPRFAQRLVTLCS